MPPKMAYGPPPGSQTKTISAIGVVVIALVGFVAYNAWKNSHAANVSIDGQTQYDHGYLTGPFQSNPGPNDQPPNSVQPPTPGQQFDLSGALNDTQKRQNAIDLSNLRTRESELLDKKAQLLKLLGNQGSILPIDDSTRASSNRELASTESELADVQAQIAHLQSQ